jgi:hypothetical protein
MRYGRPLIQAVIVSMMTANNLLPHWSEPWREPGVEQQQKEEHPQAEREGKKCIEELETVRQAYGDDTPGRNPNEEGANHQMCFDRLGWNDQSAPVVLWIERNQRPARNRKRLQDAKYTGRAILDAGNVLS